MKKYQTIRFPIDFFDYDIICAIESLPYGDELLVFYMQLWCEVEKNKKTYGKYEYKIGKASLTDDIIQNVFELKHWNATNAFKIFEKYEMAIREEKRLIIIPFWLDKRDSNSPEYRYWRKSVLERDEYKCQICGAKKNLQAHHIVPWSDRNNKSLRFDINNGITLCRDCHLKAHGGSWR